MVSITASPYYCYCLGITRANWYRFRHAMHNPFCWLGWLILVGAIFGLASGMSTQGELRAFVTSNVLLVGLLGTGAAALLPVTLYSTLAPENSLTAYGVAASTSARLFASIWWPVGLALAISDFVFITRRYAGKVSIKRRHSRLLLGQSGPNWETFLRTRS